MKSFLDEMQRRRNEARPLAAARAPKTPATQKPFVRAKTKKLIEEGKSPKQAFAIANKLARQQAAKRKSTERARSAKTNAARKVSPNGFDGRGARARPSTLTPREAPMAKKKTKKTGAKKARSPAQKAATAKMLAANKAKNGGGARETSTKTKKKPSGASTALARRPSVGATSAKTRDDTKVAVAWAMENNITWAEGLLGGTVAIAWFGAADLTMRLLGSHAVTAPTTAPTAGQNTVFQDVPTVGQQYNWIGVAAPMNMVQWGVGILVFIAIPLGVARFVFEPGLGRSTFHFMFLGGVLAVGGRGATTGIAYMLRKTGIGQRIYAPEINAQQAGVLLAAAIKANAQYVQPPLANAIPAAAGVTLTPQQPGVAGAPQNDAAALEAQRRAAGVGGAPANDQQQERRREAAPPPPPPPPPDDADDAPPTRSYAATPLFGHGVQQRVSGGQRRTA